MTRSHPIIALDSRRRHNHYADFHRAKRRIELDLYHTGLRNAERRANHNYEIERINAMLEHKLFAPGTEVFLHRRRSSLGSQIGELLRQPLRRTSLGHM